VVAQDTNQITLSVESLGQIVVPIQAVIRREPLPAAQAKKLPAVEPPPRKPKEAAKPSPPAKKTWNAKVTVGSDLLFSERKRQLYYSRTRISYDVPIDTETKRSFRGVVDYNVDYGKVDGVVSTDRMSGSVKTDVDLKRWLFVYALGAGSYDHIRRINQQHDLGGGTGYHLWTGPVLKLRAESGLNYSAQDRSQSGDRDDMFGRLALDMSWKIAPRIALTQIAEFLPLLVDLDEYRMRLDATLSFGLTKNLSFNISLFDLYETNPANRVNENELQLRSSLGVSF
jgi:hypothetical protein